MIFCPSEEVKRGIGVRLQVVGFNKHVIKLNYTMGTKPA